MDLVILCEHGLIDPSATGQATRQVWAERDDALPPQQFPPLPTGWLDRYERVAAGHGLETVTFEGAVGIVTGLWTQMFPTEEI